MTCCHFTLALGIGAGLFLVPALFAGSANQPPGLLSDVVDISPDFHDYANPLGCAEMAPFDAIPVAAAAPDVPAALLA